LWRKLFMWSDINKLGEKDFYLNWNKTCRKS
jgi:hypothetical protein